jgi:hypothetical protein
MRIRSAHIFSTIVSQPYPPAVLYLPGRFLVLISVRGRVDSRATERLEGLGKIKNPVTSSGIENTIFAAFGIVSQPNFLWCTVMLLCSAALH